MESCLYAEIKEQAKDFKKVFHLPSVKGEFYDIILTKNFV